MESNAGIAEELLEIWAKDANSYDLTAAIALFPSLADAALRFLEAGRPLAQYRLINMVDALAMDGRVLTARRILTLIENDALPATALSGRAFEQINWTLGPNLPHASGDGTDGSEA